MKTEFESYDSLRGMETVLDNSRIMILDDECPNTFAVLTVDGIRVLGIVCDDHGCSIDLTDDNARGLHYIGVSTHLIAVDDDGNVVFHLRLKSIYDSLFVRPNGDIVVLCELDLAAVSHGRIKWETGFRDMVQDYEMDPRGFLSVSLWDGDELRIDLRDGSVS